ncbi:hypothetical protein LTR28_006168 [Elasticomyces elasticus]|nr:hypothetical protein LTR28_006168 [Elasticomyces elasticus]
MTTWLSAVKTGGFHVVTGDADDKKDDDDDDDDNNSDDDTTAYLAVWADVAVWQCGALAQV